MCKILKFINIIYYYSFIFTNTLIVNKRNFGRHNLHLISVYKIIWNEYYMNTTISVKNVY